MISGFVNVANDHKTDHVVIAKIFVHKLVSIDKQVMDPNISMSVFCLFCQFTFSMNFILYSSCSFISQGSRSLGSFADQSSSSFI